MENKWYIELRKQITHDTQQYKNIIVSQKDKNKLDKSRKHYKITVKHNKILNDIPDDFRLKKAHNTFKLAINFSEKYNLPKISGDFYVRISDGYEHDCDYPVFNYSKPKKKIGFLFPDFSFLSFENKLTVFEKHCNGDAKKEIIYFKGSSTSNKRTRVREKLSALKTPFNISVDDESKPYYELCKYKYVLDLPGNKPWSVRLIELYISRSLPIRVLFYNSEWNENIWVQFYENMFQPWESYIPLKYDVDYDNEISNNIIDDIELKCLQCMCGDKSPLIIGHDFKQQSCLKPQIFQIFKKYDEVYKKIINDNYEKIKALKLEHVEYYMYHCVIAYMDIVTNINKK